jgi:hypothetical protein
MRSIAVPSRSSGMQQNTRGAYPLAFTHRPSRNVRWCAVRLGDGVHHLRFRYSIQL